MAQKSSELPPRETALAVTNAALDDACVLDRFVYRPTFDYYLARLHELDPGEYSTDDIEYLSLVMQFWHWGLFSEKANL